MHPTRAILPSLFASLAATGFVCVSSSALPDLVASHFDGSGSPNGFMPRPLYVAILIAIAFVVPLLLSALPLAASGPAGERLNLPDKSYWLHPDRRDNTFAYIARHGRWFGYGVTAFLSYVHWLVVQANAQHPARLSPHALNIGLAVFLAALLAWLVVVYAHFRTHA
jgi:uncharacterized membrane protein